MNLSCILRMSSFLIRLILTKILQHKLSNNLYHRKASSNYIELAAPSVTTIDCK